MAAIIVLLSVVGCAACLFLKGTLVRTFATLIAAVCASAVAFAYFESLANILIKRNTLAAWAQSLCFTLLFALTFALLQIIIIRLTRQPTDFGTLVERTGRLIGAIVSGLIIAGVLLTVLALAPLSNKTPYQRFDSQNPDAQKPGKAFLNADGLTVGWFSLLSRGSFSGKKSFAVLHADFLNQVFLNRHKLANDIAPVTDSEAIELPSKEIAWPAPPELKDTAGRIIPTKPGQNLTIVRVGLSTSAVKDGDTFTLSQLRLICNQTHEKKPFAGTAKTLYPIGYLKKPHQLELKKLDEQIKITRSDFPGPVRYIDFLFYVPNNLSPVLVEFKQNSIAQIPASSLVSSEQAPPTAPLVLVSECATDIAAVKPVSSDIIHGVELAAGGDFLADVTLGIKKPEQWNSLQTADSIMPAELKNDRITSVRAELKSEKFELPKTQDAKKPETKQTPSRRRRIRTRQDLAAMLQPLNGYELLSLLCSNPPAAVPLKGRDLPVLVELSGIIHHPVGVVAAGKIADQMVYEVDYCALTAEQLPDGLVIAENGSVAQPFPPDIWLTEQAETISEFYVLYLVKKKVIITAVQPADSKAPAEFEEYEGFFVR